MKRVRVNERIEVIDSPGLSDARPWYVEVDGLHLRGRNGVGRRFKTQQAAARAGRIAALANAVEQASSLPRCKHGAALRDGAGDRLTPPCGCLGRAAIRALPVDGKED